MPLMDRHGTEKQASNQFAQEFFDADSSLPPETVKTVPQDTDGSDARSFFEDFDFIKNNALQKTAIDSTQYPNYVSQIQGFMAGSRLQGVYFSSLNVNQGERTNIVDDPALRSNIHSRYDRFDQFEITLPKAWDYSENPETASSKISFVAWFYPGFNPKVGDIFLTATGPGKIGVFKVTMVTPGSWVDNRAYEANLTLVRWLDREYAELLAAATRHTGVFSKSGGINGTSTVLTYDSYNNLNTLRDTRNILLRKYFNLFYDDRVNSFIRPDGYYDPYVVQFVNTLGSVDITAERAIQLFYEIDNSYERSFWSRMESGAMNDLDDVYPRYICNIRTCRINDTFITALSGHGYISLDYDDQVGDFASVPTPVRYPYVFSQAFYEGLYSQMTPFEIIVYDGITKRTVADVGTFIKNYLKTWVKETKYNRFYITPIYIWLCDIAIASLQKG